MEFNSHNDLWPTDETPSFRSYPFSGRVRLILNYAPWQMALLLNGIEISNRGVKAAIERKRFERLFTFSDLSDLFRLEDRYFIQVESELEYLPMAAVSVELSKRELSGSGIALSFDFLRNTPELDELIQHVTAED